MWSELLPKLVGGIMRDDDAPDYPTEIIGFDLDDEFVTIKGKEFDFFFNRKYGGIGGPYGSGQFRIRTVYGMGLLIEFPKPIPAPLGNDRKVP